MTQTRLGINNEGNAAQCSVVQHPQYYGTPVITKPSERYFEYCSIDPPPIGRQVIIKGPYDARYINHIAVFLASQN